MKTPMAITIGVFRVRGEAGDEANRMKVHGKWLILSHALTCMTAPSAEGAKGDFASAEARRQLSDRPRHPFGSPLIGVYQV